jgi:transposase InsO family protein
VRGFLGTVGAVRQFVPSFAKHDAPLRKLLHKQNDFIWTAEHTRAVEALKEEVGQDRILVKLVYGTDRRIILAVDSSQIAAGFALFQEDEQGVRRPARFDSVPFNEIESRYSQPKLELCGVYKALKRCRLHLYGQRFTLEVDARSLVQMLNSPDLPSSPMTRWLAFIKLFDLEVVHVPAEKHLLVDGLSRAYFTDEVEEDMDNPIKASHSVLAITDQLPENPPEDRLFDDLDEAPVLQRPIYKSPEVSLIDRVPEGWKQLVSYLIRGTVPGNVSKEARKALLSKSDAFFVSGPHLYRRSKTGINQQVVFDSQEQEKIVLSFHEIAHRGISAVAQAVCQRYWWSGMHKTLREVIRACDACQRRARDHPQPRELLRPTIDTCHLFQKVAIDIVHMGQGSGSHPYLVLARDDLSGWVEGRALVNKTAEAVSEFFQEEVFSRYGPVLDVLVNDNGKEFQGEYAQWIKELEIDHRQSTPYNPQAHGAIERGHAQIFEAICKISVGKREKWSKFLPAVLYADRITTKRTTGYSAFELVYGALPCLPLDVDLITWVYTDWSFPMTSGELLYQRTRQIVRSEEMQQLAAQRLAASRKASSTYMDEKMAHRLREPLKIGDFVLVHDSALATAFTRKMDNRWYGPFLVVRQHAKGSYFLAELDGTPRVVPVAPSRLRKYFPSGRKPLTEISPELFMPVSLPKRAVP